MTQKPLVIISGGTSGIGFEVAKKLCNNFSLALIYKSNHSKAELASAELYKQGATRVEIFCEPVTNDASAKNVYQRIQNSFSSPAFALINAAGYTTTGLFLKSSEDHFKEIFDSHVFGVIALTKLALEDMYTHKFGRIINMSSIATLGNQKGLVAYASAKAAIEGFTKSLSSEVFHRNITVNAIQSGLTYESKESSHGNQKTIPVEHVASFINYLISIEAGSITGSIHLIDGGSGRWF